VRGKGEWSDHGETRGFGLFSLYLCLTTLLFIEMTPSGEPQTKNKPFSNTFSLLPLVSFQQSTPPHLLRLLILYLSNTFTLILHDELRKVNTRLFPTTLHGTGGPRLFPHRSRCARESCRSTRGYTASPSNTLPTIRHAPTHYTNELWDAWIPACIPPTLQGNKRSQALPPPLLRCARESCRLTTSLDAL
jgi:hypothetical protein